MYGSTARGQDRWDSDIDLVAEFPAGTSLFEVIGWQDDLRNITGDIRVDLVGDGPRFGALGTARQDSVAL